MTQTSLHYQTVIDAIIISRFGSLSFYNPTTDTLRIVGVAQSCEAVDDEWIALPNCSSLKDLRWMRDFARKWNDPRGEELFHATYEHHPYREFKMMAKKFEVLDEWQAYRNECINRIVQTWFEVNNLAPIRMRTSKIDKQMKLARKAIRST